MNSKARLISVFVILGIVGLVFLAGCGGGTSQSLNNQAPPSGTNPIPMIAALSPSIMGVGGPAFTLNVNGSNFVPSSVVRWNGSDRATAFQNSTQVTAQIPASDIAATGTAAITVFNPTPGGGTSNSLAFTITSTNPVPTLSSISPTSA